MRHRVAHRNRVAHRKLGRITPHRIALLRNLATSLFEKERIRTTLPKAKELRPFAERLITLAKSILRLGTRKGDGAEMAYLELVGYEYKPAGKHELVGYEYKPAGKQDKAKKASEKKDQAAEKKADEKKPAGKKKAAAE